MQGTRREHPGQGANPSQFTIKHTHNTDNLEMEEIPEKQGERAPPCMQGKVMN